MALGDGIRRNIASVEPIERELLRDAFIELNRRFFPGNRTDPIPGGVSWWFKQDEIHQATHVHGGPEFLPWHREIVNRLEEMLRQINPQLSLHYWDWTQDPRAIPNANLGGGLTGLLNLFTPAFMGYGGPISNPIGEPWLGAGYFVPGANPDRDSSGNPADPPATVIRSVSGSPASAAGDMAIINAGDYAEMRGLLENVHNDMHGFVNKGSQHFSFRDPFVFLLHSNVDRLFARWQTNPAHPERLDPNTVYGSESGDPRINRNISPWSGVPPITRPWAPPENQQVAKTYKDPSVVAPPRYDQTMISPRLPSRAHVTPVSRSADKLDIFVTDVNSVIRTAAWEPAFPDWWHGWWELNGGRAVPGAPVHGVSRSQDKLDVFVIGTDNRVWTAAWEPGFPDWWHGWWQLNQGVAAPGAHVTVVSRSQDKLDVFVVGTDNRVWTAAWEPGFPDGWHGWWPIGNVQAPAGAPVHAVSRSVDKLDIFVTDINGVIQTAAWEPAFTDGWHGWWELNGGRAVPGAHVTVVSRSQDKLDVFVVGTDNRVWTAAWEPGFPDGWHGWWPIGNVQAPAGAPVHAVSRSVDKLDIFVTDINGVIQTAAWDPTFPDWWHGWWELNGGRAAPGAPVTVVSRSQDKLDVFVVGTDNRVWTAAWEPGFADWWHGWWPIGI